MIRIGIDLGGTKIEGVALDERGSARARRRIPTPRDYDATVEAIGALVDGLEGAVGERGSVGVGTPGAVSPATGRMKNCNSTWLNGRALREDLAARLGREVRLANDANCFALSEATDGAAAGARCVFGAIIGTGTGGGVVVDLKPLGGLNGIAGEWGHNPLPWPEDGDERFAATCWCGKTGCIETFLSGPALKRDHASVTGEVLEPEEIVRRAAAGDDACEASLRRYDARMARALASLVNVLDPDVIVLGGGLSNLSRLYQTVPALLPRWVFSDRIDTPVRPPVHGDASGVRGAAWLW